MRDRDFRRSSKWSKNGFSSSSGISLRFTESWCLMSNTFLPSQTMDDKRLRNKPANEHAPKAVRKS